MAEMTEAAHLDAREVREPVTPEVTGPVRVPEFPLSGDVDVATINAATDAFINGMVQAVGEENDPRVKKTFQMWTVMGKLVTSNACLLSHHLEQMNEKLDGLTEWMKKDCESGQSCFEETRGTMAEFAKKFDVLSESIKSLYLYKRGFYFYKRVFEKLCLFKMPCQRPCSLHHHCLKVCVSWKASSQRTCSVIALFLESLCLWEKHPR